MTPRKPELTSFAARYGDYAIRVMQLVDKRYDGDLGRRERVLWLLIDAYCIGYLAASQNAVENGIYSAERDRIVAMEQLDRLGEWTDDGDA